MTTNSKDTQNEHKSNIECGEHESNFVNPLLTDLYQITMTYAYFINKSVNNIGVFDLFFRKCPFKGEYCIFAGLNDCLKFLHNFKFTKEQLKQLSKRFPKWDPKFWDYLSTLDAKQLEVYAIREGSVVFPREPLLRIKGPLALCQLVETTFLNLINYASLVATNACRMREAVGPNITLLEFGLRRAQGPDGGMSASRYAYLGGFNGTSNVLASLTYNIPVKGTHAHSFISSYTKLDDVKDDILVVKNDKFGDIKSRTLFYRKALDPRSETNNGELAAFIAYANAFPDGFLGLIDTYNTETSGMVNFMCVTLALNDFGHKAVGIRLDSGDLAYLSIKCRHYFTKLSKSYNLPWLAKLVIVASNDIHEKVLYALKEQGHKIDSFGIGTHLVTCKAQPALGCVYKLVEISGKPRIKASNEIAKMTIPARKQVFRLYGKTNSPLLDLMTLDSDKDQDFTNLSTLKKGQTVRCYHPSNDMKRVDIVATKIEPLLIKVWEKNVGLVYPLKTLDELRKFCREQVGMFRNDYKRYTNPTPYKVSISRELRTCMKDLIEHEIPVQSLS